MSQRNSVEEVVLLDSLNLREGYQMRVRKGLLAGLGLVAGLITASCMGKFPETPNWYGKHTGLYSMAFRAAALEHFSLQFSDTGYYASVGDAAFSLRSDVICSPEQLAAFLREGASSCNILGPAGDVGDCINSNGCIHLRYNPAFNSLPRFREELTHVLKKPCDALSDPSKIVHRSAPATAGMSPEENWRLLRCESDGVYGHDIEIDEDSARITFKFHRGS